MGDFIGFICSIFLGAWVTVCWTNYTIDAKDTYELLTEVCKKNGGIVMTKISIDSWRFECTDGAVFKVDR